MASLQLLLLLSPLLHVLQAAGCIDWAKECKEAACFSKYSTRAGLGLFVLNSPAPRTGIALSLAKATNNYSIHTRVSIHLEGADMQDDDYATIAVGNRHLGGCHKGNKNFELNTVAIISMVDPPAIRTYTGNVFCCVFEVANLDLQFVDEPSSKPLLLIYTTGNRKNTHEIPTDFSARMILSTLEYRKEVSCDVASFRIESKSEDVMPYYPFQDPASASCQLQNHGLKVFGNFTRYAPLCKESKWIVKDKEIGSTSLVTCEHYAETMRRPCAGAAPPAEFRCGKECGVMHLKFYKCEKDSQLFFLDDFKEWRKADAIRCAVRGFVAVEGKTKTLLSDMAMVQCRVRDDKTPAISFIAYSWTVAIAIGLAMYITLYTVCTYGCRVLFDKWRASVEAIGPVRVVYGAGASLRTAQSARTVKTT